MWILVLELMFRNIILVSTISVHIDISVEETSPIHYTTTLEDSGSETIKEYDLIVHILYIIVTKLEVETWQAE